MKIRESGAKASRKHRESETFHFQSLRPALPGPEMCDSTATSTTSVPTPAAPPAPVADKPSITEPGSTRHAGKARWLDW